jgi:hypothetical protein
MDNFIFFTREGLFHVLDWNAYDHLLFLIALVVVYDFASWKRVLWLISLFTIGHTFSLIMAVYGVVAINADLIEFLIPITILITALANIIYAKNAIKSTKTAANLMFALVFGLIHGFAFSSGFKMLIGMSEDKLVPLLEFALGIELAQILTVIVILALGFIFQLFFRLSKRDWTIIVSSIIIGALIPILRGAVFW